jgi:hypothetical protein
MSGPSSFTFSATGGTAPYTWAVTSGALPTGMSLSSSGVLSGRPTTSGRVTFTVTCTDANGCTGAIAYTVCVTNTICGCSGLIALALPCTQTPCGFLLTIGASTDQPVCDGDGSGQQISILAMGSCGIELCQSPESDSSSAVYTAPNIGTVTVLAYSNRQCTGNPTSSLVYTLSAEISVGPTGLFLTIYRTDPSGNVTPFLISGNLGSCLDGGFNMPPTQVWADSEGNPVTITAAGGPIYP